MFSGRYGKLFGGVLSLLLILQAVGSVSAADNVIDLSQGEMDMVVRGDQNNGYLSELTGTADFNGDGRDDLLLGATGDNQNGYLAGAAYLILGQATLPTAVNLKTANANFTVYGAMEKDMMGHSMAGGDINGDGYADMIIAADHFQKTTPGSVYVFLGDPTKYNGNTLVADLGAGTGPAPDLTIHGEFDSGRFGRSVASGDVNGDGRDDIIVGAYLSSPSGRAEAGAVYVFFGKTSYDGDPKVTINLKTTNADVTIYGAVGDSDGLAPVVSGAESLSPDMEDEVAAGEIGDRLGRSVSTGDINGDGVEDILTSSYGANVGGNTDAGKTYVFFGGSFPGTIDLLTAPADMTLNGINGADGSGFYVSAGDLNGDGFEDVLSSAYTADGFGNAGESTGEVYAVFGKANPPATMNMVDANVIFYGAAAGDRFGRSLAAGDFNGDGIDDVAIGASRADPNGKANAGREYVIYGGPTLKSEYKLSQAGEAHIYVLGASSGETTCEPGDTNEAKDCADEAGRSTSFGDLNGDGTMDLVVGALYANNGTTKDTGAAYVLLGSPASSVTLTPDNPTVKADTQLAFDLNANNKYGSWNVNEESTFSISSGSGGSFNGNVLTTNFTGTFTVTGKYRNSLTDTTVITVNQGDTTSLNINPDTQTVTAGNKATFTVLAKDSKGNTTDVTNSAEYSISPLAGGSWSGNEYTTEKQGAWTVTATYEGVSATADLIVEHAAAQSITISPDNESIFMTQSIGYTALATDAYGNSWDITQDTNFTISAGAGGSFDENVYTSGNTGTFTVSGDYLGKKDSTSLTVKPFGQAVALTITPEDATIVEGESLTYTAMARNASGFEWDVSESTSFKASPPAGGKWIGGNTYQTGKAGEWVVTGSYAGVVDSTFLTIMTKGTVVQIFVTPSLAMKEQGEKVTYRVYAKDNFGVSWEVTGSSVLSVSSGAGGSWSGNVFTTGNKGTFTITATYKSFSATSKLMVLADVKKLFLPVMSDN